MRLISAANGTKWANQFVASERDFNRKLNGPSSVFGLLLSCLQTTTRSTNINQASSSFLALLLFSFLVFCFLFFVKPRHLLGGVWQRLDIVLSILLDTRQMHSIGTQLQHLPLAPTWFSTEFCATLWSPPTSLPPAYSLGAMFDLISSKLSSVSTENTSVSFPASLSVSRLSTNPVLLLASLRLRLPFGLCCVPLLDFAFYFQTTKVIQPTSRTPV